MPTKPSPNETTFWMFFDAIGNLNWGNALDCVADNFRGTISRTQKNLSFQRYKEEMERVRNALEITNVSTPAITIHDSKITAVYTVDAVFARDLQPQRGSRADGPLKANGKPVVFDVRETYTFNDHAEITSLISDSLAEKVIAQMGS